MTEMMSQKSRNEILKRIIEKKFPSLGIFIISFDQKVYLKKNSLYFSNIEENYEI